MRVNSLSIKLKVLGVGLAVVLFGMICLGNTRAATAATLPDNCPTGQIMQSDGSCGVALKGPARPAAYDFMARFLDIPPERAVFEAPEDSQTSEPPQSTIMGVPLPLAWPLFGAALIGIGYLGRRRKPKPMQEE